MKTQLLLLTAVIVVLTGGRAHALPDKTFTSSGQILPGEEWNSVYIYNDDTIVDMLGGSVDGIAAYDASTLNVLGGFVSTLIGFESSLAHVSAGQVYSLSAEDSATVTVSGSAIVSSLSPRGIAGNANIYGGTIDYIAALESGSVNLYAGLVTDSLYVGESATANIFGYDLVKTSSGGAYGHGQVYGFWLDDTPFTIDLYDPETYLHITLIPEPTSLLLLALGGLLFRNHLHKTDNFDIIEFV